MPVHACVHGTDGHATAGGIDVLFGVLRVFLRASSTDRVHLSEHLRKRLAVLTHLRAWFWGVAHFFFLRATTFVFKLGLGDLRRHLRPVFFCNRFPRVYAGGVAVDVTYELPTQGVFDHDHIHTLDQHAGRKFDKRLAAGGPA